MKMRFFFFLLEYAFTKHIPLFLCRFGRRCLEVFKYDGHLHIPETEPCLWIRADCEHWPY